MSKVIAFPGSSASAGPASDAAARAQALDIRASCIVEAPAGSGKTGLLVQRYLKLLADEAVNAPEEVLAVTFTRKATAELRERVLQQLLAAARNEPLVPDAKPFDRTSRELALAALERSAQLNWRLLEQPLRLNIRTFDAVAMQIANALPLLSGSGGPRAPLENAEALYRMAARRTLLQLGGPDRTLHDALRNLLLHRDGNLDDCEGLLAEMLGKREQWGELVPLDRTLDDATLDQVVRPRLERALAAIVGNALQRALQAMPPGVLQQLCVLAERLSSAPGYQGEVSPIAVCSGKLTPPQALAAEMDHWLALIHLLLKKDGEWRRTPNSFYPNIVRLDLQTHDRKTLQQLIAEIETESLRDSLKAVRALPPAGYPDDQWLVAKSLFHILRHALAELKVLFAARGECDFCELALAAREALRRNLQAGDGDDSPSDLALSAGGHLRHLLIDEMQDTSAGQYELLDLLTRSWDGHTQTLFLVGDPKQSIYLFRAASVERFLRTMREQRLGEVGLTPLYLTANFRSQAGLIERFNASFAQIFPRSGEPLTEAVDVLFVAATADREQTQDKDIVWHTVVLEEEQLPPGVKHAQLEARTIRGIIEERLAQPLPAGRTKPWKVAVLGHGRKHLAEVVKEFNTDRGHGRLAFKAVELDPLHERPEVLDAFALARALLHPADRTAWLAVLHAPWCGLGLADLLTLTGDGSDSTSTVTALVAAHSHLLSEDGQALLARAWPVLAAAVKTLGRTPLSVHVDRTWRSLGGDATLTNDERANVQRFLGVLRELESEDDGIDLNTLSSRLDRLYAEPFAGEAHVELLTIHKAKGLEWDLVLVPGMERGSGNSRPPLLNWLKFDTAAPQDEAAVVLAPISSKGTASGALGKWLTGLRSRREAAERKRLFYVACTRAKEELHLFAAVERKQDGDFANPASSSLLRACWPAAEEHFARLRDAAPANVITLVPAELEEEVEYEPLALAAAAESRASDAPAVQPPTLQRLPLSFRPMQRFADAAAHRLEYPAASLLQRAPAFDRPEGSFAVRAFGNVVHRYLQLIAARLTTIAPAALLVELPGWQPRLEASLRGEGLPPAVAAREAVRALRALTLTLNDATGLWLLSPHPFAASEQALSGASAEARTLRVDRTFLAGEEPLSAGEACIWIVDFKTTEQGARGDDVFAASERAKYNAQLEAYAAVRRNLPDGHLPIRLGLYFPLLPRLIHWPSGFGSG